MSNELILVDAEALVPAEIFKPGGMDAILQNIRQQVACIAPDVSTAKGRAAIASLAHKVAKSKVLLDDAGKTLVAEWKQKAAKVDEERRKAREFLDTLRDEVREPLSVWEAEQVAIDNARKAEEERIEREAQEARDAAEAAERAETARKMALLQEALDRAEAARVSAEKAAEDARLAAEAAARREREAEDRAVREREDAARAVREAAEKAEADRLAAIRAQEEEAARAERERLAEIERAEAEAARVAKAEAEAVEAERRRVESARAAEEAAEAQRQADARHRKRIHAEIREDMEIVVTDAGAVSLDTIIKAIANGFVRHVDITY